MDDFRCYINPQPGKTPRFSAKWQLEHLPPVGIECEHYTEDRTGKQIDALIRSLRPGSVVVVRRLFCLAPWIGTPTVRKNIMAKRVDAIRAAGGVVMVGESGCRTDQDGILGQMIVEGVADIASAGRAGAKGKRGNPIELTPDQLRTAEFIWRSREYANDKARLAAIKAQIGREPGRTWCWNRFGKPKPDEPKT
jgi:hypothetical protein